MKFSIGYQLMSGTPDYFYNIVRDYQAHIREVYFAWPGVASGRTPLESDAAVLDQMQDELRLIAGLGIKLNLLFNASCYGDDAVAASFADNIKELTGSLSDRIGIAAVTTMSPVIAGIMRKHFPAMDVRASVNMRLGTVRAMEYVTDFFDSYYVQREYNRDPERLRELQDWAQQHGKQLYVLANSGCLNFCSFQTFHDNVVAHEGPINRQDDTVPVTTLCRDHYAHAGNRVSFLQGSWIRPEDIRRHREYFSGGYKLATRMHSNPRLVIDAYAREKHNGNLLDLMEPGFGPQWWPDIIDNPRFPADWFTRTMQCDKKCSVCGYCRSVDAQVRKRLNDKTERQINVTRA
jgi:collagenase-like PrtC family protease